jgi:putative sterol carrier protein
MVESNEVQIRQYRQGDEDVLSKLRSEAYAEYAGVQTPEGRLWRWLCVDRPSITADNVLVAESSGRPVGYVSVGTDGTIYDILADPKLSSSSRRKTFDTLLDAAEVRMEKLELEAINLSAPGDDRDLGKVLSKRGYRGYEPTKFVLCTVDVNVFLNYLTKMKDLPRRRPWRSGVSITLEKGKHVYWEEDTRKYYFDGKSWTMGDDVGKSALHLTMKMTDYLQLIQGNLPPVRALLSKTVRVDPPKKILAARRALNDLVVDLKWYVPISDHL